MERTYDLRSNFYFNYTLERKRDHTVYHGSESLFPLAPDLQYLLKSSIKKSASLKGFETKINTWTADHCPWIICKK